jgi:hypothetical protein
MPLPLLVVALTGQEPRGQEPRDAAWKSIEEHDRLIELRWRRDAKGNFEFARAAVKEPEWSPWFAPGPLASVQVLGVAGPLALLGHSGDVLSLTNGERHLRRIGVAMTTGDLAAFVRTPLADGMRDVALLDRMVAIDVLRRRDNAEAKLVAAQLAADGSLDPALRRRAGEQPVRLRLEPETWPLPAAADAFVVVHQSRLPAAHYVLELGRISGLISSARVLQMLKAPTPGDLVVGETECEAFLEAPFELARHLGNHRLDQTAITIRLPAEARGFQWTACSAGRFDVGALAAAAPNVGMTSDREGDTATIAGEGMEAKLTATMLAVRGLGVEVAPRPDLAQQLLAAGDAGVLVHVPAGSALIAYAEQFGLPGVLGADLTMTFDEENVRLELRLGTADAAAAKALVGAIETKLEELGGVGALETAGVKVDQAWLRIEPQDGAVRVAYTMPRAAMPTVAEAKAIMLKQWRQ